MPVSLQLTLNAKHISSLCFGETPHVAIWFSILLGLVQQLGADSIARSGSYCFSWASPHPWRWRGAGAQETSRPLGLTLLSPLQVQEDGGQ